MHNHPYDSRANPDIVIGSLGPLFLIVVALLLTVFYIGCLLGAHKAQNKALEKRDAFVQALPETMLCFNNGDQVIGQDDPHWRTCERVKFIRPEV